MTVEEAGRKGGLRTSATHGEEFYSEIGRKGGKIGGSRGGQRVRKLIQEERNTKGVNTPYMFEFSFIFRLNLNIDVGREI